MSDCFHVLYEKNRENESYKKVRMFTFVYHPAHNKIPAPQSEYNYVAVGEEKIIVDNTKEYTDLNDTNPNDGKITITANGEGDDKDDYFFDAELTFSIEVI